jgi:hypothetical protein
MGQQAGADILFCNLLSHGKSPPPNLYTGIIAEKTPFVDSG